MLVTVALSPRMVPSVEGTVCIVLDVLRASNTMLAMFEAGASALHLAASPEDAVETAARNRAGHWVCGERDDLKPEGFDLGCAPIVRAFDRGERHAELWQNAQTAAAGMRVPVAIGDYLILGAVRDSGGTALTVSEQEIRDGQIALGTLEGVYAAPEGGATYAALKKLRGAGFLTGNELVVLFQTGMGIKYDPPIGGHAASTDDSMAAVGSESIVGAGQR